MSILSYSPKTINYYTRFLARERKDRNYTRLKLEKHIDLLNSDQRNAISIVEYSIDNGIELHYLVLGVAGTGKSYVLRSIRALLVEKFGEEAVLTMAMTGVAATTISGQTVHSALKIPLDFMIAADIQPSIQWLKREIEKCKTDVIFERRLIRLQLMLEEKEKFIERISKVKFFLADELSMISLQMLAFIDSKLKDLFESNKLFAGKNFIMFGDFGQLPPVGGTPFYGEPKHGDLLGLNGQLVYKAFEKVCFLDAVVRQQGEEQERFRQVLMNFRNGCVTQSDVDLLNSRVWDNLDDTEKQRFCDATHLFYFNCQVSAHNEVELGKLDTDQIEIAVKDEKGNMLDLNCKKLAIGAKVMLLQNIWTEANLVNGSLGVVKSIIYSQHSKAPNMPAYVNVIFEDYRGPFPKEEDSVPIQPVVLIADALEGNNYKQLPVRLAYGLTVHKSQSKTLPFAVIDFRKCNQLTHCLVFVALSRVPSLSSLALMEPFKLSQFENQSLALTKMLEEEQRLRQLAKLTAQNVMNDISAQPVTSKRKKLKSNQEVSSTRKSARIERLNTENL